MSENSAVTRIYRSRRNRVISGVVGGFAEHFGIDVNLARIVLVVLTLLGFGTPMIAYLVCWLLLPEDPR